MELPEGNLEDKEGTSHGLVYAQREALLLTSSWKWEATCTVC